MRDFLTRRSSLALAGALLLGAACGQAPASQTPPKSTASSEDTVVASIGDRRIKLAEVDEKALQSNMSVYQELYNARRQALDEILSEALLEREASSRGVSLDELLEKEVTSKVEPVTEADVQAFFDQNQARLGGRTLDQIGPQIRQYLGAQRASAAREDFLSELKAKAGVAINLDPPRVPIQIASNERIKGPADAPVTIIEYSDFQ